MHGQVDARESLFPSPKEILCKNSVLVFGSSYGILICLLALQTMYASFSSIFSQHCSKENVVAAWPSKDPPSPDTTTEY